MGFRFTKPDDGIEIPFVAKAATIGPITLWDPLKQINLPAVRDLASDETGGFYNLYPSAPDS
jgi:hypothetical protein